MYWIGTPPGWRYFVLTQNSRGLEEQNQHHNRRNIANHHDIDPLPAEGAAAQIHLANDIFRVFT